MEYLLHLLILIGIFSILTLGLNALAGFTGILSLSHATFYGIGAYATAILTTQHGWGFLPSAAVGMLLSAVAAWLASFPLLRLKGDALVLVSFGFAIIMYNVMLNLGGLTGGPLGIKGIRLPSLFGFPLEKFTFLALVIGLAALTYLFFKKLLYSPYGTVLKTIRENPLVAAVSGHNVVRYQRSVYTVAAVFAALAGSLIASYLHFIEPKLFELMPSVFLLVMVILGGLGNLKGSLLGTAVLLLLPEILRFAGIPHSVIGEVQQMIYGLVLVALMVFRPQGLLGEYKF